MAACRREGIPVTPIPGPSAAIAALVGSGLPTDTFLFAGFLPPRSSARRNRLEEVAPVPATLIFYEAPHRLLASLGDMVEVLGDRKACMVRELTKIHEEFLAGTLSELHSIIAGRPRIQGEITLVVDRGEAAAAPASFPDEIERHLTDEMERSGLPRNEALKSVARQRGITRKEAYNLLIGTRKTVT